MKMKIVALAAVLVLLVPGLNAFAADSFNYEQGVMDNPQLIKSNTFPANLTDNSSSSGSILYGGNDWTVTFSKPLDIKGFYVTGYSDSNVRVIFRNSSGVIAYDGPRTGSAYKSINADQILSVTLKNNSSARTMNEVDFFTAENVIDLTPPGEITALNFSETHENIRFTYELPTDTDFSQVEIYKDNEFLGTTEKNFYTVNGLEAETLYNFKFVTVDVRGNKSVGITQQVTTQEIPPEPVADISNLEVKPTHERIDISWKLPESDKLKHVNIYRDLITEISLLDKMLGITVASAEASTKIFETNGTYFNDLTVEPETSYEYTLKTLSVDGVESDGITTTVKTLEAPPPKIIGGDYEKDPATGDFVYSWTEPTEGQVKVFLDGTEYKTVDSAAKKIVIPAAEMKYNSFGEPLLSLQPIGTNGKIGETVETGSAIKDMALPFGPLDLLKSGNGLLMVIGGFLLLALSFLLVPRLIRMIKRALGKESEKEAAERRIKEETKARKTERRERERREARETRQAKKATAAAPSTAQAVSKAAITERQERKVKGSAFNSSQKEPRTARERKREGRQPKAPKEPRERNRTARAPRNGRR